jgi:DNA-binding transcriptional LysR family regulator
MKRPVTRPPADIGIRQLAAFVSLAENGSFTRAAAALDVSQPALTATIKQLEAATGVALFDRTTRQVTLTQSGAQFVADARRVIGDFNKVVDGLRELATCRRGSVRIASVPSFVVRVLPKLLREFSESYPNVSVRIDEENEQKVLSMLLAGDTDLGFGSDYSRDPDLIYEPLVRDDIGLLCRADHPLGRRQTPLSWSKLDGLPFVAFHLETTIRRLIESARGMPKNVIEPAYEVSDVITMEALLEANLGVAATFRLGAYRGRDRKLVFRPLANPALSRNVCLVTHAKRTLSPAAAALRERAIDHLRRRTDRFKVEKSASAGPLKPAP